MPETLDTPYAVIRTGGKQYPVKAGQELLIERLTDAEGATIELETLLLAGGGTEASFGASVKGTVTATVLGHERGPKVRIFKYKPKRGYKRRMGHRQELTRIRVDAIG